MKDLYQWVQKCKPDLKPYSKVDDAKFQVTFHYFIMMSNLANLFTYQWLEEVFLGYIKSIATDPIRGNSRWKRQLLNDANSPEISDAPLPKCKRPKNDK